MYVAHLGWHHMIYQGAVTLLTNPRNAVKMWVQQSQIPNLRVDLDFEAYQQLHAQQALALQRGANLASATDYVPATVTHGQEQTSVILRLPEVKSADLSAERWPLELVVSDGHTLLGMRWAELKPATAEARLAETYLTLSHDAGIPTFPRYVVNLIVNGAGWGTYILQAQPATEMLRAEGFSPESVVVWFDQRAYLEAQPVAPGYSFAYARIAVARRAGTSPEERADARNRDPALAATYAHIVNELRMLERGDVTPSHVFDVEKLGRFLALRTLWYGTSALDWRSLVLIYEPASQTFTPVAQVAPPDPETLLPATFTYDAEVWDAYMRALETLSTFDFQEFRRSPWGEPMQYVTADIDLNALQARQARLRDFISPPRTLFAEADIQNESLVLRLDAMLPFPVEIVGLEIGERGFVSLEHAWVAPGSHSVLLPASEALILPGRLGASPMTLYLDVPVGALPVSLHGASDELALVTRIWGLDEQIKVFVTWSLQ